MMTDQPPAAHSARQADHEHLWRAIDSGQPIRGWAYRCDICHRTWAGFGMADEQSAYEAAMESRLRDESALKVLEFQTRAQEARRVEREQELENVLTTAARDWPACNGDIAAKWQAWLKGDESGAEA